MSGRHDSALHNLRARLRRQLPAELWPGRVGIGGVLATRPGHARLLRHGGAWYASRVANGLLALVHVWAVTRALGPNEAGHFFMLWTAAWILSVVARFGTDGIVARVLAEAAARGGRVPSLVEPLAVGVAAAAALLVPTALALGLPASGEALAITAGLGLTWAATGFIASTLKGSGRTDLSGLVQNVLWPLASTLVALAALVFPALANDWRALGGLTAASAVLALAVSAHVAARALGARLLLELTVMIGERTPVRRDEVGAAVLTALVEVYVWLPVVIGAAAGVEGAAAAGLFAATRVAGVFSWGYQAVVATLVPSLAQAVATRDRERARRLLLVGCAAGLAVTLPACALGAVLAGPILALFSPSYVRWEATLVLLVLARLLDAAAGPQGELLLVGRRTWVGAVAIGVASAAGAALALVTRGPLGDEAVGVGALFAFLLANGGQLLYVRAWVCSWDARSAEGAPLEREPAPIGEDAGGGRPTLASADPRPTSKGVVEEGACNAP